MQDNVNPITLILWRLRPANTTAAVI